jgi:AcrR family transcriptional regulator
MESGQFTNIHTCMHLVKTRPTRSRRDAVLAERLHQRKTATRQQARTAATKEKLLEAAGRIFARDGFEAARLEDIASAAGYTRGAFYANFKDKEELFFALLEQWVHERMAEVNALLEQQKRSPEGQLRALRNYYVQTAKDRRLALLSLEFTLYAIRHPAAHTRLRTRSKRLRSGGAALVRRIAQSKGRSLPASAEATATALGALANALFLEHVVDPKAITEAGVRTLLGISFDALIAGRAGL